MVFLEKVEEVYVAEDDFEFIPNGSTAVNTTWVFICFRQKWQVT